MVNSKLAKKITAFIGASAVTFSTALTTSCVKLIDDAIDQKPYEYVLRDYESFHVDTSVVDLNSARYGERKPVRLRFSENRPVIVDCDKDIEEDEKKLINEVISYYNDIFSTINENYKFIIKSDDTDVMLEDTVIMISNIEYDGINGYAKSNVTIPDSGEGAFVLKAAIGLVWDRIGEYNDDFAKYVIFHEFSHLLGLGDVYYTGEHKKCDYIDMTTSMQLTNEFINCLYPNDYAILQALYSNEYSKHNNYEEAVKVVNKKIEQYTNYFYDAYSNFLHESKNIPNELNYEDIPTTLKWDGKSQNTSHRSYELNFTGNNECEFIIKDKRGNLLERCKGNTVFANGVLYIRNLYINEATNFSKVYEKGVGIKLFLCVHLNLEGELVLRDASSILMNTGYIVTQTKQR